VLGLFNGTAEGSGFTNMTFTVKANNVTTLLTQTFTSASDAVAYFTNHAIDLGSLSSGALNHNTLNLSITEASRRHRRDRASKAVFLLAIRPRNLSLRKSRMATTC